MNTDRAAPKPLPPILAERLAVCAGGGTGAAAAPGATGRLAPPNATGGVRAGVTAIPEHGADVFGFEDDPSNRPLQKTLFRSTSSAHSSPALFATKPSSLNPL